MAQIRYEIIPRLGGWSIACGNVAGPPYMKQANAVRDAAWTARLLQRAGEQVELYLEGRRLPIEKQH